MMTEKVTKVRYLNDAGIELLRQGHMKNTKEFLYVTVKDSKLYIFDGTYGLNCEMIVIKH